MLINKQMKPPLIPKKDMYISKEQILDMFEMDEIKKFSLMMKNYPQMMIF